MRRILPALLLMTSIFIGCNNSNERDSRTKLWYDTPADEFVESLVMGNGQLGAIVYGGVESEKINLNDITLWSGEPVDLNAAPKDAHKTLSKIRKALANDNYREAEKLQADMQGKFSQSYQPMATLGIHFGEPSEVTDYYRELDLKTATTTINYNLDGTRYSRTCFVSHPDKIMAIELEVASSDRNSKNGRSQ